MKALKFITMKQKFLNECIVNSRRISSRTIKISKICSSIKFYVVFKFLINLNDHL